MSKSRENRLPLPPPSRKGPMSVEESLDARRSVRDYAQTPLSLGDVSQLLWAAQGVTHREGWLTAPSAGALYPLEVHLVAGDVDDLPPGVYRFAPRGHGLIAVAREDVRGALCAAALDQDMIKKAPAVFVVTAVYARTTGTYGERGRVYVHLEVGHALENLHLQAVALGLGAVIIGAFEDRKVQKILGLPANEQPLGIMAVGRPL